MGRLRSPGFVVLLFAAALGVAAAATIPLWISQDPVVTEDIDQVYGAASATISTLALCGVAISLTLQWRQVQVAQVVAARERHFELVMLAFEDPKLAFERSSVPLSDDDRRVWMHSNLWMTQWNLLWQLRQIDEAKLRQLALALFADPPRLTWWQATGSTWSGDPSHRGRKFFRIVAGAHHEVQAGGGPDRAAT